MEGRKNSPKYKNIKTGDSLRFINGTESFLTIVTEIRCYTSLEEYLEDVSIEKALPGVSSLKEAMDIYHQWSTSAQIEEHSFLGIFVKLI